MSKRCKGRMNVKAVKGAMGEDRFLGLANCAISGVSHMAKGNTFMHAKHNLRAVVKACSHCTELLSVQSQQAVSSKLQS
jgi:hypothetical protein